MTVGPSSHSTSLERHLGQRGGASKRKHPPHRSADSRHAAPALNAVKPIVELLARHGEEAIDEGGRIGQRQHVVEREICHGCVIECRTCGIADFVELRGLEAAASMEPVQVTHAGA